MKSSIKDFFSKCDQILMENFNFCPVFSITRHNQAWILPADYPLTHFFPIFFFNNPMKISEKQKFTNVFRRELKEMKLKMNWSSHIYLKNFFSQFYRILFYQLLCVRSHLFKWKPFGVYWSNRTINLLTVYTWPLAAIFKAGFLKLINL